MTSVYKNKLLRLLFLIGKTSFFRRLGFHLIPTNDYKGFVLPYLGLSCIAYRLQQRRHKGSLIVKAISTALHFTNHYSFLDFQTRRCNVLLILLMIFKGSHFYNQLPSSYKGFGYSVDDCQRFKRFGDIFNLITFLYSL